MYAAPLADLTIARLHWRADPAEFDALAAKLELERLLANLSLSFPRLSPSAILCIRSLPDPDPGRLRFHARADHDGAWSRAFLDAIERKLQRAARPALAPVPADAEAVVFADSTELVACLAKDASDGLVGHWWWRSLLRGKSASEAILAALTKAPEDVPAVVDALARHGRLEAFLRGFSDPDIERLLDHALERYGLVDLRVAIAGPREQRDAPARVPRRLEAEGERRSETSDRRDSPAPWTPWWNEAGFHAPSELHRLFVGIAVSLRRAPNAVRGGAFARALQDHLDENCFPTRPRSLPAPTHSETPEATDTSSLNSGTDVPLPRAVLAAEPSRERLPARTDAVTSEPANTTATRGPADSDNRGASIDGAPLPTTSPAEHPASDGTVESPALHHEAPPLSGPEATPLIETTPTVAAPGEEAPLSRAITTRFGGLFYLVNLALALELYPDFTRPRDRGLWMSVWQYVRVLGTALLGEAPPDPVWALLSELEEPDEGEGPVEFTTPPESPSEEARARWLEWHLGEARAHLAKALGARDPAALRAILVEHRARVHVTEARVDVVLALSELPIALRVAGLDRNPGFLPTAGRSLAFHFQ